MPIVLGIDDRSTVKEVGDVKAQRVSDQQEVAEFHLAAALHPLDGRPVDAAGVGEHLLGHVLVQPSHTDAVAGSSAGVENPLGLIGWHPTNLLPTMIICQQQI
ncbi:hypothetical protein [Streptomyces mirabilis]|uniref:hypothetical protein n=1 Tax=Streptomyces mirabilis TaxID=68239 RepID=UPI003F4C5320